MRTALGRLPLARAPASDGRTDSNRQPAAGARFADDFTGFTKQLHRRIWDALPPDSDRFVGWLVGQRRLPIPTDRPMRPAEAEAEAEAAPGGPPARHRRQPRAPPAPQRQPARGRTRHNQEGGRRDDEQASKRASEQWCTFFGTMVKWVSYYSVYRLAARREKRGEAWHRTGDGRAPRALPREGPRRSSRRALTAGRRRSRGAPR